MAILGVGQPPPRPHVLKNNIKVWPLEVYSRCQVESVTYVWMETLGFVGYKMSPSRVHLEPYLLSTSEVDAPQAVVCRGRGRAAEHRLLPLPLSWRKET